MPNPENIEKHKWKKGECGNPKGRPKLPDLKELIAEYGEDNIKEIVLALFNQAKKGNVKAIQEVLDRYYGKVSQTNTNINVNSEVTDEERHKILDNLKNGR